MNNAVRAAENVARASYGRLLAILASRSSDIASAEDALSEAFSKALTLWPRDGVPDNPDAWLVRVARNRLIDGQRRNAKLAPEDDMPELIAEP
jgi:RNA polymerase sigma-70 factor (ECF subfamily)